MLKSTVLSVSLSVFSLGVFALPDTVDISGVQLGADMEEAVAELKERYPDAKTEEREFTNGAGLGYFFLYAGTHDQWKLHALPDGSGRVVKIYRSQNFDEQNVGMEATKVALIEKYGQEDYEDKTYSSSPDSTFYWLRPTGSAPAGYQFEDPTAAYRAAAQMFNGRFNPEDSEYVKSVVSGSLRTATGDKVLAGSLSMTAILVEPVVQFGLKEIEAQKRQQEEERQRKLAEAENKAADI